MTLYLVRQTEQQITLTLKFGFMDFVGFETVPVHVDLIVLELAMQTNLVLNSQRFSCLCLPNAGVKGLCYHVWLESLKKKSTPKFLALGYRFPMKMLKECFPSLFKMQIKLNDNSKFLCMSENNKMFEKYYSHVVQFCKFILRYICIFIYPYTSVHFGVS